MVRHKQMVANSWVQTGDSCTNSLCLLQFCPPSQPLVKYSKFVPNCFNGACANSPYLVQIICSITVSFCIATIHTLKTKGNRRERRKEYETVDSFHLNGTEQKQNVNLTVTYGTVCDSIILLFHSLLRQRLNCTTVYPCLYH